MNSLRILFVYQFLTLGGVEVVIQSRLTELIRRHIDARALFLESYGGESLFEAMRDRIAVRSEESEIEKYLADFSPDWICSIDTPAISPMARNKAPEARLVYEVHTPYPDSYAFLLDPRVLDGVCGIIVPSQSQKDFIELRTARSLPISVVLNPISPEFFQTRASVRHQRPIVMWVGRLDTLKNWRGFVELAKQVLKRADAEFWLVGGLRSITREQTALFDALKEADLMERFKWLPAVEHEDMPHLYNSVAQSNGCVVSTSLAESFGMVSLEAMASRCPVVAPDVVGLRDVVMHHETGWLYPPGNTKRACELILESLENSQVRGLIIENAEALARRYTAEAAMDQFLNVLSEWSAKPQPTAAPAPSGRQMWLRELRILAEQLSAKLELQVAALAEKEQVLGVLNQRSNEQQQTIDTLAHQSNQQQQKIETLSQQSHQKQQLIESLSRQSAERQQTIDSLQTELTREQSELASVSLALGNTRERADQLEAKLHQKEVSSRMLSEKLRATDAELQKIKNSLGWRLLSRYGRIKYRYLLPVYRLLGLGPKSSPVDTGRSTKSPASE